MNRGMFGFSSFGSEAAKLVFETGDLIDGVVYDRTTSSSFSSQTAVITPIFPIKVYAIFWRCRIATKLSFRELNSVSANDIMRILYDFNSGVGINNLYLPEPRVMVPPFQYFYCLTGSSTTWNDQTNPYTGDDFSLAIGYDTGSYGYCPPVKLLYQRGAWV